ncbi:hypothetical protein DND47_23670 [Pseudomonas syringae pv. syringae]|nr:hypothetical protein DND47_23670 [Pseudomonas syringae pv. syringae]
MINLEMTIMPMLRVGMQPVTLRVTHPCRYAHPSQDAGAMILRPHRANAPRAEPRSDRQMTTA